METAYEKVELAFCCSNVSQVIAGLKILATIFEPPDDVRKLTHESQRMLIGG